MQGAMCITAQLSWPPPRWRQQKCWRLPVSLMGEACRSLRCCAASVEAVVQPPQRAAVEASSPALHRSLAHWTRALLEAIVRMNRKWAARVLQEAARASAQLVC